MTHCTNLAPVYACYITNAISTSTNTITATTIIAAVYSWFSFLHLINIINKHTNGKLMVTLLVSVIILITITAIKTRKNKITQRLKMSGALKAKGKRSLICNVRFLLLSTILNFVFLRYTSVFHRLSLNRVVINSFLPLFDFFFILLLFRLSLSIL